MKKNEEIEKYVQKNKESFDIDKFIEWLKNDEVLVPECIIIYECSNFYGEQELSIIFNNGKQRLFYDKIHACYVVFPVPEQQATQCKLVETTWKELKVGDIACAGRTDKAVEDIECYIIKISKSGYVYVLPNVDSIPYGVECDRGYEDNDVVYKLIPVKE